MSLKETQAMVSVIMPTYNCGRFIAEAIASVQAQTYHNWEILIVDDCSQDDTAAVVESFLTDERIRYSCLSENGGPAEARNAALRQAQGDYIAFLDSDDAWHPEKLKRQLSFMRETGCYFSCTGYKKMDEQGKSLNVAVLPHAVTGYWKTFFLSNPIGNSTVIYDRRHFGDVQAPVIRKRNDFAFWLKLLRGGDKCCGMEDVLMYYRVRKNSVSAGKLGLAKYHWQLYRNIEKRSRLVSFLGVLAWAVVKGTGLGLKIRRVE